MRGYAVAAAAIDADSSAANPCNVPCNLPVLIFHQLCDAGPGRRVSGERA